MYLSWLRVLFLLHLGLAVKTTTYTGNATWYDPSPSLTACGKAYSSDDAIVAISSTFWGSIADQDPNVNDDPMCNKTISVSDTNNGSFWVSIKVSDKCGACGQGDLDLSAAAFKIFRDLSAGKFPVTWIFLDK